MTDQPAVRDGVSRVKAMRPMRPRSPDEEHRAATPLELFFDLVFVVAIAQAAERLHHGIAEAHVGESMLSYGMVFFAIWWAWMNFTWFASAYDTDDVPYRLAVLVQLGGALILAAGIGDAFDAGDWTVVAVGYVVMRIAMVTQWLRAARSDPAGRAAALRYAAGIAACQVGWVALVITRPDWFLVGYFALVGAELVVPVWAERTAGTPWHRDHIVERYGLFTIIVLGESILAASIAIENATRTGRSLSELLPVCIGGLLIVFCSWWLYFARPEHRLRDSMAGMFAWGYGHLLVFASVAAVGAGIAVTVDYETGAAHIDSVIAGAAVAIPVAITQLALWAMHVRRHHGFARRAQAPVIAVLVLATPWSPEPVLATGLLLAGLLTMKLAMLHRAIAR